MQLECLYLHTCKRFSNRTRGVEEEETEVLKETGLGELAIIVEEDKGSRETINDLLSHRKQKDP